MSETEGFSHLNDRGEANMVDVSSKAVTKRIAKARAVVSMAEETATAIRESTLKKGEVLAVARVAGIQAAKRTADLIPLCHPLPITKVEIDFELGERTLEIAATCVVNGQTGVEMEALTAASVTALTVYDMCKAVDKAMTIEHVALLEKSGGRSGDWRRSDDRTVDER